MFDKYEKAILALANYSKFYGVDTEDEVVFREYVRLCNIEGKKPSSEVSVLLGLKEDDNCVYSLSLLRTKIKIEASVKSSMGDKEQLLSLAPELFFDNLDNAWNVESELFEFNKKETKTLIGRGFNFLKDKAGLEQEFIVTATITLTKKINFVSDNDGQKLLLDAWENDGFIPLSEKWKLLDQKYLNTESDIQIRVRG